MSYYEEHGGTYTMVGDYLIPDLTMPEEEKAFIGRFGRLHKSYLKKQKNGVYMSLLLSGKLNSYLAEIDETATNQFEQIVAQMAKQQGVTETLKTKDQMKWVGMMNNIRNCAEEVLMSEIVY